MTRTDLLDYALTTLIAAEHSLTVMEEGNQMSQEVVKQVLKNTSSFAMAVADALVEADGVEHPEFMQLMRRAAEKLGLEMVSSSQSTQMPRLN